VKQQEKTIVQQFDPFAWRAIQPGDATRLHAMLLERDRADGIQAAGTLEGMRKELEDTWLIDREEDTLIAITPQGEAAAFAFVFANPKPVDKRQAYIWVEVHPAHRLPGLRQELVAWTEQQANRRLDALGGRLPKSIGATVLDTLPEQIKTYHALGFDEVRYFYHMRRDLQEPLSDPALPPDLRLVTYEPSWSQALMQAFNESFADHWNFTPVTEDDWQMWFVGGEDFRPDLTYLVLDGEEIAAFSINGVNPARNQQRGIQEGWIHQLGTRRAWRQRGLATTLLLASMQALRQDGLAYATLGVDTQNPTGALRIYERVGFKPIKRMIAFEKRPV
jgi:ribosomal protein S18 acetylase RimI-like enzyme